VIEQDTIISLATKAGESAIGLIRISGNLCRKLSKDIFRVPSPTPRRSNLRNYVSVEGKLIDQVLFVFFDNGKSYTGEEIIEIAFHGNPLIADQILNDLLRRKCRLALPGEYTKRAFLNGKIDLSQAESVAQLISAKSEVELEIANNHLLGNLSKTLMEIQSKVLNLQARFEASIDFPEDEISDQHKDKILEIIDPIMLTVSNLLESENISRLLANGIKISLIGPPNVGKSSIFNKLLYDDRALVDREPGTTRDYLSKEIVINGFNIEIFDTAGIRNSNNNIEALGIQKSVDLIKDSKIILLILDSSLPYPTSFFEQIKDECKDRDTIIIQNKSDLTRSLNIEDFPNYFSTIQTSTLNQDCAEVIQKEIQSLLDQKYKNNHTNDIVVNKRQHNHLYKAYKSLKEVRQLVTETMNEEIILQELKLSLQEINSIIGIKDNEDMLTELFKNFCIGK
tara:strand:+ start:5740 stop:7098 length:1359 start_codon:yes stop_codon:yes gene_type:complete